MITTPPIHHPRTIGLRIMRMMLAAAALGTLPVAAGAQDAAGQEARLRKIEAEVRALQRKVFPGGDGRFFEPQIAPGTTAPANGGQVMGVIPPATTAVSDILVRLDALETQLQSLTARSEEQANTLAQLERRLAALEAAAAPSVAAPTVAAAAPATTASPPAAQPAARPAPPATRPATTAPATAAATTPARPAPAAASPSAERLAAVQAITKPQTADPGDDEYSYGFRLWNAGFYPEARQQLTRFVEQYPNHARISYGRNLLGRAFLDDKLPEEAARWFLKNYQADKNGARAPDSLLYLGKAMIALKDTKRACIALAEFAETYPLIASGRLASEYQAARASVTCN
ncbi:tetratricopeptide repeat protein [Erythrobacter tepidarius]|uniref:tetratricopeptide repeat protein n=1 Tax=Erythrobacter tepidarius TaxID=60454 RepID=UPI001FE488E8|nr:tetratricopeptide repeat protein [Erythrobacter tepidarius]